MASASDADNHALESGRLWVVLATVIINIGFAILSRDALLGRFLLFGMVVGFTELPADAWLVEYTRTLDYSIGGGPMLWLSPLWMPFAWEVVAVQFGYIGLRLWKRFGKLGLLIIGLLGAINIPFYEEMARRIHWWQYGGCRMISFTPWYIILGEFGIALVFALLARTLRRGSWGVAIISGAVGGLAIFACYANAFWVTDQLIKL